MEITNKIIEQLNRIERNTLLASKNVLNFEDAALLTGFSRSHLYKLTCNHEIPHYKPCGKTVFFERKEIEDWLLQNKIEVENTDLKKNG